MPCIFHHVHQSTPAVRDFEAFMIKRARQQARELLQEILAPTQSEDRINAVIDSIAADGSRLALMTFTAELARMNFGPTVYGLIMLKLSERFRDVEMAARGKPAPAPAAPAAGQQPSAAAVNLIERLQTHLRSAIGLLRGTNSVTYGAWATEVEHSDLLKPFPIA